MILLLSIRLLDDRYHGLADNGEKPEWPPSPFRLFQALVAGNAHGDKIPPNLIDALKWLESLDPPEVVAVNAQWGQVILTYVLNNTESRSRTPKTIRPTLLNGDNLIEYAWNFDPTSANSQRHAEAVAISARHIRSLGWGIDLAIGFGELIKTLPPPNDSRIHFRPILGIDTGGVDFRVPQSGSLISLQENYAQYLRRYEANSFTELESAGAIYQLQVYKKHTTRPFIVFRLLDENDDTFRYNQAKLIHIAAMVRHLAKEAMTDYPPENVADPAGWIRSYVCGHQTDEDKTAGKPHEQLSYLPLPSHGMQHTDPSVRRVMIAAPVGHDRWLEHLALQLDGQALKPLPNTVLNANVKLSLVSRDNVARFYTKESNVWASVTPVILPGHNDRKEKKTAELICKSLKQSGIEAACSFEWSEISHFSKSLPAYKYRKDPNNPANKVQVNYIRPDHLLDKTGVHLRITFNENVKIAGPLVIGAGRHCGLGLMAGIDHE